MAISTCDNESDDRRNSYRCAVAGPRAAAVLRLGTREVDVEIVDESAKGFAVVIEENVRSETGQRFSLGTADGWVEVEVKNIQFQQWTSFEEGGVAVTKTRTRLGLLRLRDLEVWKPDESLLRRLSLASMRKLLNAMRPLSRPFSRAAAIVLGIVVTAVGVLWGLEQTRVVEYKSVKELPQAKYKEQPQRAVGKYVKHELPKLPKIPKINLPQFSNVKAPNLSIAEAPDELLRMLSRRDVLFDPDVVSRLVLSPQQLQELEAIYRDGQLGATRDADAENSGKSEIAIARKGLSVLTESQQRSLLGILADVRAAEARKSRATAAQNSPTSETRTGDR